MTPKQKKRSVIRKRAERALVLAKMMLGSGASKDRIEDQALELMGKTDEELNSMTEETEKRYQNHTDRVLQYLKSVSS